MDRSFPRMPTSRLCDHLSLDDFIFLNPTGLSLSPDDTRSNFFLHIGLQESIYRHRLLYRKMKAEAKAGMERLFSTRQSLHPNLVQDHNVVPPYHLSQMTETAFQHQIERIYEASSKSTRGLYDIVGGSSGNWAIRWLLWRVIQERLAEEAISNRAEIECSISPNLKYSITGLQTPQTSPIYTIASSHDYSDSEGWDDVDSKIKMVKEESFGKPATRCRSSFWTDVMNT